MSSSRFRYLLPLLIAICGIPAGLSAAQTKQPSSARPNIVIIFADDLGYADIAPFGSPFKTPHLERMASEGRRFTDFYAAQAVCSASRAALLTGCYPNRVSIQGALGPKSGYGLSEQETTIASMLKPLGYATAIFGKWHLGVFPEYRPTNYGFDEFFCLPYSNDMWPLHPDIVHLPPQTQRNKRRYPPLPLWKGNAEGTSLVIDEVTPEDQSQLTTWYTEQAVDFINRHHDQPFFVYLPHSMPHVPLFVSDKFAGKSGHGTYGDVIQEIDWSVGEILKALEKHQLSENTLVIFTSDNGPWLSYGNHAGSAGPLREGKGTAWEGGQREPTIFWWPGQIPAGTICAEPCGTIDLLPTIAALTDAPLPKRKIDGLDISPLLTSETPPQSPHEALYYYWLNELHAVRSGPWKLHFPHPFRSLDGNPPGADGTPAPYKQLKTDLALYNLSSDIGEQHNVADQNPEVVARLTKLADKIRSELGDSLTNVKGNEIRPPKRSTGSPASE